MSTSQKNPSTSETSFTFGNAFILNGRTYIPFTEQRNIVTSANANTANAIFFNYRVGTIIKRVMIGGGAFTGSIGANFVRQDGAGVNRIFGQAIPIVTETAGGGSGTNLNEMPMPQEIVEDGQSLWGLDVRAGGGVSTAFTTVRLLVDGWKPV